MDKWDGQQFIDDLQLSGNEAVLEIGVGTGRLAIKVCAICREFYGIDLYNCFGNHERITYDTSSDF